MTTNALEDIKQLDRAFVSSAEFVRLLRFARSIGLLPQLMQALDPGSSWSGQKFESGEWPARGHRHRKSQSRRARLG
jgi:hypothetical protein